ncbi:MAG: hypothetical protein II867_00170 [Clostridia bacterium]|nr:hypothetical protein [Clostridia bacterium]
MADAFKYNIADVIKCKSCGADMVFDPASQKLRCPYCDITRDIEKRVPHIRDFETERKQGGVAFDGDTYKCPNCGGETEIHGFDTAVKCPFCGGTNVIKLEDMKGLKPDSVLPFALTKETAVDAGRKWIKKKFFAPSKLKKNFTIDKFHGVYIPSFAFNSKTFSTYDGRFGEDRTRTVQTKDGPKTEHYIEWYHVSGNWNRFFENTMVEASTQIRQDELNKILPYDMDNATAYTREYLAGFSAERYDTSLDDSFGTAKTEMNSMIRREIINHYNPDHVDYLNVNTTFSDVKFRHTLLPLWICGYKFKEKIYRFLINARTGKATGKVPKSPAKIAMVVFFILAVIAAIVCIIAFGGNAE